MEYVSKRKDEGETRVDSSFFHLLIFYTTYHKWNETCVG